MLNIISNFIGRQFVGVAAFQIENSFKVLTNEYLTIPSANLSGVIDGASAKFSILFSFKVNESIGYQNIFSSDNLLIRLNTLGVIELVTLTSAVPKVASSSTLISNDSWHTGVITFDYSQATGSRTEIYIDSILDTGSDPLLASIDSITTTIGIAADHLGALPIQDGNVQIVSVINRVINQTEITEWHDGGQPLSPQIFFGDDCKYFFNPDNSGSTAEFSVIDSVNSITATSVNFEDSDKVTDTPYGKVGFIYNESSWADVSDFTLDGNATAVLSGSKIDVGTTGGGVFTDTIRIDRPTGLDKYKITFEVDVINAPTATSYGLGIGVVSRNTSVPFEMSTWHIMWTGATRSDMAIYYNGGSGYGSIASDTSGVTFSQNDILRYEIEQDVNVLTFTVSNLSTTSRRELIYTYTLPTSPFLNNAGDFALYMIGGTYEMQKLQIESKEFQRAKLMCIGDSKTVGYSGTAFNTSYPQQLLSNYGKIANNSGGSDKTAEVLLKVTEIIAYAPKKVLLNIGSNDKRDGVTLAQWKTNYDSIVSQLSAAGISVYHLLQLNETVLTFTDYNAHINATYSASKIVDAGTISLDGDGIHPSQTGMDEIYSAIVAQIGSEIV